jgi:hypothetical protein
LFTNRKVRSDFRESKMKAPGATLPLSVCATPNLIPGMFVTDVVNCDSDIFLWVHSVVRTCDTPLNFFHKILRVLSSVRHFFYLGSSDTHVTKKRGLPNFCVKKI